MFDPSKINLDENSDVSKSNDTEEIKSNIEEKVKQEEVEVDVLGDINKDFIEQDLINNEIRKSNNEKEKQEDIKKQNNVVGDISQTIELNKKLEEKKSKINKNISKMDLIDINIDKFDDILNIMLNSESNIFVFEPRENDIKIIFKEGTVDREVKYIKFPVYNQILLGIKSLNKVKVEETKISQEGKGEIQLKNSKYNTIIKTVPSAFGEKLFFKMNKVEKKIKGGVAKKTSIGTLFGFLGAIAIVALVIGGAFISFIVMNATTLEDVKFFYSLGINLNDINNFISKSVNIIFSILVFFETVFLAIFLFKALLTKKIYKKKRIAYIVFTTIILIFTFTTGSAWMYINKKIANLPNWQIMAQGDVQIFDNSKLLSGNFSEGETLLEDTTGLIGPVTLKFDLSSWEYKQKNKGFEVDRYEWSFGGKEEKSKKIPEIIKTFSEIGTYNVSVDIYGKNSQGEEEMKQITNISSIEISNFVKITEKIDKNGLKTIGFDANDLKELGKIDWYFIDKENKGELQVSHTGYEFYPGITIMDDIMVGLYINREGKESEKLDKIFIIKKQEKSTIEGEIKFTQDPVDDLKYTLFVKNPDTAFGNGFVETFIWKIEDDIKKKESSIEDVEGSSKIEHIFESYGKQDIEVELIDSSGKSEILRTIIDVPKKLKLKSRLKIENDGEQLKGVRYEGKNNEYYIDELSAPTILKFDARLVKSDNIFYKLVDVSWDLDDDGTYDKKGKLLDLPIDVEGNKTIIVKYKFLHRKIKNDIVYLEERIYIESLKKDVILRLKIEPENKYVPTFVRFDASLTQVKGKNIEKFIYDYGDGTPLDERDAINPAHKYTVSGEYNIKLIVITTDGEEYNLNKKLVLNSKPQKVNIDVSMKKTKPYQEIDFSSEGSEGQIISYFWDFGDGEVSTEGNPSHAFEIEGKYNVKLKVVFQNKNILEDYVNIEIGDY